MYMHIHEMPPLFSVVRPGVQHDQQIQEIVFKAMAKQLKDRYQGAIDVFHDLKNASTNIDTSKHRKSFPHGSCAVRSYAASDGWLRHATNASVSYAGLRNADASLWLSDAWNAGNAWDASARNAGHAANKGCRSRECYSKACHSKGCSSKACNSLE